MCKKEKGKKAPENHLLDYRHYCNHIAWCHDVDIYTLPFMSKHAHYTFFDYPNGARNTILSALKKSFKIYCPTTYITCDRCNSHFSFYSLKFKVYKPELQFIDKESATVSQRSATSSRYRLCFRVTWKSETMHIFEKTQ